MSKTILDIQDLHINFKVHAGEVQAIRGIDLKIKEGEIVCLVGESGSGKSVTAKSILGLLPKANTSIPKGKIILDDMDITNFDEKNFEIVRGKKVAMIFQDPMTSLNPVITIGKQILEAIKLHHKIDNEKISKSYYKDKVLEYLELVDIKDPLSTYDQYPHQLSGGMRQRIVIAIALACEPQLLIADEPTTALDVIVQDKILELIKKLQKKFNFAVLFITHDLGVVANVADYIAVMYAGKIVELGNKEDIFYNSRHPYTWGLLASMPDIYTSVEEKLYMIPGTPPNLLNPPKGDAFAPRNEFALDIDFELHPPMFKISKTHSAATWLLDKRAPKVTPPLIIRKKLQKYKELKECYEK